MDRPSSTDARVWFAGAVEVVVGALERNDWPDVRAIFTQGIEAGDATFETAAPDWADWDAAHRADCRLVARVDGEVVGWAALSPVSERCAYDGVAETSVYVSTAMHGRGVGGELLRHLIAASEEAGIWTLQAGVFPENERSVRLHRAQGFRIVGVRERFGHGGDGAWRDVLLLERRSSAVGT
jgi:L-amino acid N-acyltransferase YncA